MNILLLSNSAPNYFYFFNSLASKFMEIGSTVVVAVDSTFSREENNLDSQGFVEVFDFSVFFKTHKTDNVIIERYKEFNLNAALLSDFERAQVYGVWGGGVSIDYYDRLRSALLTYFEEIFETHKIDMVLYENVSNAFAHYALFVAQKKGAVYCGIGGSRLPGRFSVTSDPIEDDLVKMNFEQIRAGKITVDNDVEKWVTDYLVNIETITPDYMKFNGSDRIDLFRRYFRSDRFNKIKSLIRHLFDDRLCSFQIGNPLITHFNLFMRNVKRRFKVGIVRQYYQETVDNEKYLLYPIHFHPESSTSILSGTYLDEYEVIRNIAFNLPVDVRLYVKDHISAFGFPSLNFYKRISVLPNVRLLAPEQPTKKLIKNSVGVITLTSTVGYEALLLKKQVFLYGHVFYEFHKGVKKVDNASDLFRILEAVDSFEPDWDEQYNLDFVTAYYLSTLPGSLNLMLKNKEAKEMAEKVYDALVEHKVLDYA